MLRLSKIALLFLLLFSSGFVFAQTNLVPNPSFEIYSSCPIGVNDITATGWVSTANGTSDYFNGCASQPSGVSVPNNLFGSQNAATGNAYCGFHCYNGNYREIIEAQLSSPLSIGQKYFISIKVSQAGSLPVYYGCSVDKIGVKCSTVQYSSTSVPINNFAHIYSSFILSDTTNWTIINGSFISDSSYLFINVGNFFDDANTDTMQVGFNNTSYYYVDDICVSTDSALCYSPESVQEIFYQNFMIYPNPSDNFFLIKEADKGFIINAIGEVVANFSNNYNHEIFIDCSQWSNGIYFLKTKKSMYKIIIQH